MIKQQAQERQEPAGAGRDRKEEFSPADTLISDFWPPELKEYILILLRCPVHGNLIQRHRKLLRRVKDIKHILYLKFPFCLRGAAAVGCLPWHLGGAGGGAV